MAKNQIFQYYVEGKDEEKIIGVLKTDMRMIQPGRVQVFNVVKEKLTENRLRLLKPETTVVLVFDTDTESVSVLEENLKILKRHQNVKDVICITQVENLEDELVRSCDIRTACELTGSKTVSNYKRDLINEKNLRSKLELKDFDINKFWSQRPHGIFEKIPNEAYKIKF